MNTKKMSVAVLLVAVLMSPMLAATISRTEGSGTWDFNTTWFSKSSGGVKWVSNDNTAKFDINTGTPAIIRVDNSNGAVAPYRMEMQTGNQNWYFEGDPITVGSGGLYFNFANGGVCFSNQLNLTGTTQSWNRAATSSKSDFYGSISGVDTDLTFINNFVSTVQKGFRFFGDNSALGNIALWSRGQLHLAYGDTFVNKLNPDKTLTLKHGSGLSWYGSSVMTQRVARIRLDDGVGYLQPVTNNAVVLSVDTFQPTNNGVLTLAVSSSMLWPKVHTTSSNLNGILGGWAVVETNNMTSAFATIGADGMVTSLSPVVNNTITSWTETDNVLFSGSAMGKSGGDYKVNSLTVAGTGDLNLGGGILTIGSGGILRLVSPVLSLTNGKLRSGDPQGRLFVHNSNQDQTIGAVIEDNPNGTPTKLIKSGGTGGYTLVLTAANMLTGGYYLNAGFLTFSNADAISGLARAPLTFGLNSTCGVRLNNNTPVVMHSIFAYGEPNSGSIYTASTVSDITVLNDSYYTGSISLPAVEFVLRSRGNSYFRSLFVAACTNVLFYGTTGKTNRTDSAFYTGNSCRLSIVEGEWWFGGFANSSGDVVISNAVVDVAADITFSGKYTVSKGGVFRFGDRARRFSPMTTSSALSDNLITIEDGGFLDVWTTAYGVRLGGETGNNGKKLWIRQKGGKANYGITRGAQGTETQFRYGYGDQNNSTAAEVGYELAGGEMQVGGTLWVANVLTGSSFYFDFTGGELSVVRFQSANLLSSSLPGSTGVLVNAGGTFSPGLRNAYATNRVVGGYSVISPSAGMYLEVDGRLPAAQDKFIMDTGTAVLGGKLLIDVKGFAVPSNSYDVVTADVNGTLTGSFNNVVNGKVTTVDGKYVYTVTATDKKITISAPVANQWTLADGGNWNEGFAGTAPNGSTSEAVFSYGVPGNTNVAVLLTNDVTLATLRLWNENLAYTIGGTSNLNLAAGGKITVGGGSHSIMAPVVMGGALTIETLFGELYDTYGLNVGVFTNNYASKTIYPPVTLFQKYPVYAYVTDVTAPEAFDRATQLQWVYTGYLWNNSPTNETWSFITQFDDAAYLRIDDTWVIGTSSSSAPTKGSYTLTPGAHYFEVRLGDYGHSGNAGDRWGWGMMYDTLGRSSDLKADYQRWTDADAGVRFTTTTAKYVSASALEVSQMTGGGALTKTGPGTLVLDNAVLGAVSLQGGRIVLKAGTVLTEGLLITTGTTVDFTSYETLLQIKAGSTPLGSISAVKDAITAGLITLNGRVVPTGRFVVSELDGYIRVRGVEGATVILLR